MNKPTLPSSQQELEKQIHDILAYYESDGSNITYEQSKNDLLALINQEKQLLLEKIKADLEEEHASLREGLDTLENDPTFGRESENSLLESMHALVVAIVRINNHLYPMYHEQQLKSEFKKETVLPKENSVAKSEGENI